MSLSLELFLALGPGELVLLFWLAIIMDFPRYFLSVFVVAIAPGRYPEAVPPAAPAVEDGAEAGMEAPCSVGAALRVSAIVSCYNEAHSIRACVESLRAAGVDQIVVVNDGSTDDTFAVLTQLDVLILDNPQRFGKPASVNLALAQCVGDLVVIVDADTTVEPDAIENAKPYFLDPLVAGVGLNLKVRNAAATLTTRLQAIEYAVAFTGGRMFADAFGILNNVSGAGGVFRREALDMIGGLDIEVAEDAALSMKLRHTGWKLRYAGNACAWTNVPEEPAELALQRIRWDASIITIWWKKYGFMVNPFAPDLRVGNLFTALDVLVFAVIMQLVLPLYLWWLWLKVGVTAFTLLATVMIGLAVVDTAIILLVGLPAWLILYIPLYLVVQTLIMRPLRVAALVAELAFSITKYDDYLPAHQRGRLT